jgi:hypothetical protein
MTVEELIEALREMPPTSLVEIESNDNFFKPVEVQYEMAITTIRCERDDD